MESTLNQPKRTRHNSLVLNCFSVLVFMFLALPSMAYCADQDELESLRGLKGLSVLVETLPAEAERGQLTKDQVQTDVELKLRLVAMNVVMKDERRKIPGWPCLYVNLNLFMKDTGLAAYSVRVELSQEVTLKRSPKTQIAATTWSRGVVGTVGQANLQELRNSVKGIIDKFINDYLSVNPTRGK